MTEFEKWWKAHGIAEFNELCITFQTPATEDSIAVAKFVAWNAWCASTKPFAVQIGVAA